MKLNGWQRLWIFTSGAFGCFVFVMAIDELPTQKGLVDRYESINSSITLQKMERQRLHQLELPELYPDARKSPVTLVDVRQAKANTMAELQAKLDGLSDHRKSIAVQVFLGWALVSGGLYLIGWLIAWIIRGFRADKAAKTNS